MKRIAYICGCLFLASSAVTAATNDLSATLQKGLFEEEANHDLNAAVRAYQDVVNQFDKDRKLAATAIFRLGECYSKQGKTNEANVQYERVLREFADQTELANLSRNYVSVAGAAPGASLEAMTQQDATRAAAKAEDVEVRRIQSLLTDSPDLINAIDPHDGYTLLQRAAAAGQLEVAKFLLANGADIEAKNPNSRSYTALHFAADAGNKAMVEFLLSKGAKVNAGDEGGSTPLHLAVQHGYRNVVESLIEHGADINAKTRTAGATPLYTAAANGFPSIGEFLISHGAEVNAVKTDSLSTPLHITAKRGDLAFCAILLTNRADLNATDSSGQTPLHYAVENRQTAVAALLLTHGANVDARDKRFNRGWTPLVIAVEHNENDMVNLLLTNKADANMKFDLDSGKGWTPLLLAVNKRYPQVARLLLEGGAQPNQPSDRGDVAIFWSLYSNDLATRTNLLELLLDHGAEVDVRDAQGQTPLMRACWDWDPATVQVLLAHQADPKASDNRGFTALHYLASRFGNRTSSTDIPAMAQMLISAGANVNALDKNSTTPLGELPPIGNMPVPGIAPLPPASRVGTIDAARSEFVALLREHGGVLDMPLPDRIQVRGPGINYSRYAFARGTNDWNQFTLLELLAVQYDFLTGNPAGQYGGTPADVSEWASARPDGGFPDLSRVLLRHPGPSGQQQQVNLVAAFDAGDCTKDTALDWGEVVEIPEADHPLNARWSGFSNNQLQNLQKCLTRKVEVVVKGKTNNITLAPAFELGLLYTHGDGSQHQEMKIKTQTAYWIKPVLLGSGFVLTSSDLSRVKIARLDPATGQKHEWVVDCSEGKPAPDLWLKDGDLIAVPEK